MSGIVAKVCRLSTALMIVVGLRAAEMPQEPPEGTRIISHDGSPIPSRIRPGDRTVIIQDARGDPPSVAVGHRRFDVPKFFRALVQFQDLVVVAIQSLEGQLSNDQDSVQSVVTAQADEILTGPKTTVDSGRGLVVDFLAVRDHDVPANDVVASFANYMGH